MPQIVAINSGDLLTYYGTAFGIIGSFVAYRNEIKKAKRERTKELKPIFIVDISLIDNANSLFAINIVNQSEHKLSYLYLYDIFISANVQSNYSFNVTYCKSVEEEEKIKPQYNITVDSHIIDADGYPNYIQLICDDQDGNSWNCCYNKIKDCDRIFYYPQYFEMM